MATIRSYLQWSIVVINTFCVIFGILGVVESALELQKYNYGSLDYTEKVVQIIMGVALVVSAFIGCGGALNGSLKLLSLYIFVLLMLMIGHVWKLWRYDESRIRNSVEVMITYTWIEELVERGKMDALQYSYHCCGKRGYSDYTALSLKIPNSCYQVEKNNKKTFYPYGEGCLSAVSNAYLDIYRAEKWFHVSLIGVEFFGIVLTVTLICNLTADTLRYSY
uniref:Tetraspanin n=1 Tax=Glossina morsitans morsitans TaxID=37546 RepID=A0A1B0FIL1_GLOMM